MKTSNKTKVYEAYVILCNWRFTNFKDRTELKEAHDFIWENDISLEVDGKPRNIHCKPFSEESSAMPIRIMMDPTGTDYADDWTFDSPIEEIKWNGILRWWPKSWLYLDGETQLPKEILIHYGPIDLKLIVVKPSDEVMKQSFADVIINHDRTLIGSYDQSIDNIKQNMEKNNMFGKKKQTATVVEVKDQIEEKKEEPETKPTAEVVEGFISGNIESTIDQTIKNSNVQQEEKIMNEEEAKVTAEQVKEEGALSASRKRFSKAKLGLGIGIATAIIAGGLAVGYRIYKAKSGETSSVE